MKPITSTVAGAVALLSLFASNAAASEPMTPSAAYELGHYMKVIDIADDELPRTDDRARAASLSHLKANALRDLARFSESDAAYQASFEAFKAAEQADSAAAFAARCDYVMLMTAEGRFDEVRKAIAVFAGQLKGKAVPVKQARLAHVQAGLAMTLGDYPTAAKHAARSVELHRAAFGEDSAEHIDSLITLGLARCWNVQYREAVAATTEARKLCAKRDGDRVRLAGALLCEGLAQSRYSDYGKSFALIEQAIMQFEAAKALSHVEYVEAWALYAALHGDCEWYADGQKVARKAVKLSEAKLGQNHPITAEAVAFGLAACIEDPDERQPLFRDAIERMGKTYERPHPRVALVYNSLGSWSVGEDDTAAEAALEKADAILAKSAPTHMDRVWVYADMASLASGLADELEASSRYGMAAALAKDVGGESHPYYAWAVEGVAWQAESLGMGGGTALKLYERAAKIIENALGTASTDYAYIQDSLAWAYHHAGQTAKAVECLGRAEEIYRRSYPPTSPTHHAVLDAVAEAYAEFGADDRAAKVRERLAKHPRNDRRDAAR